MGWGGGGGWKVLEKLSTPIFLFAYERKKVWKRLKIIGAIFLASILEKKNWFLFRHFNLIFIIHSLWKFKFKVLNISFKTVLFIKAVWKNINLPLTPIFHKIWMRT